jgi:hypothetical protein
MNTSLADEEMRHSFDIFLEVWKHAEALQGDGQRVSRQ